MADLEAACGACAPQLEVIRRIRALKRIPPPPEQQQRLLAALADPEIEIEVVADLINECPPVAARVMGFAGSAFFASGVPVRSVRDAVVRVLGLRLVADLVSCVALSSPLQADMCPRFEPARYWTRAVVTATIARHLAADAVLVDAASRRGAYLCGLLHNLGVLVLVHLDPDAMSRVFTQVQGGDSQSLLSLEHAYLGIDHGQAGGYLAATWGLPSEIGAVMHYHHQPEYRGEHWMLSLLVGSAARLAPALLQPEPDPIAALPDLELLGLDAAGVAQRIADLSDSLEALGELAQQLA